MGTTQQLSLIGITDIGTINKLLLTNVRTTANSSLSVASETMRDRNLLKLRETEICSCMNRERRLYRYGRITAKDRVPVRENVISY
jgi:hypothetical protein